MFWNKERPPNPYITLHKLKLENDRRYNEYLKWCGSVGEVPMEKYDFIKEIADKEKEIENLTR